MEAAPIPADGGYRRSAFAVALLLIGVAYLLNYNGIYCSNDGSHFALVRTIAEHGTAELEADHVRYTTGTDYAVAPSGRVFSDRPPGTALLIVPFYELGRIATAFMEYEPDAYPNARIYALRFFACLGVLCFALGNAALVYVGGRRLGAGHHAAMGGMLVFAFTGLAFKYSSLLFAHTPSATAVLLSAVLLVGPSPVRRPTLFHLTVGGVLGYAILIEYQNLVFLAVFSIAWAIRLGRRGDWKSLGLIAAGAALPLCVLAGYHAFYFGRIVTSTHSHNIQMAHNQTLGMIFAGNWLSGIRALFIEKPTGLLPYSPIFLFGPVGLICAARQLRPGAWALLIAGAAFTSAIAFHVTIEGGATMDCRYFFSAASIMALGYGPFLTRVRQSGNRFVRVGLIGVFVAMAGISVSQSVERALRSKLPEYSRMPASVENFRTMWITVGQRDHLIDRLYRHYFLHPGARGSAVPPRFREGAGRSPLVVPADLSLRTSALSQDTRTHLINPSVAIHPPSDRPLRCEISP